MLTGNVRRKMFSRNISMERSCENQRKIVSKQFFNLNLPRNLFIVFRPPYLSLSPTSYFSSFPSQRWQFLKDICSPLPPLFFQKRYCDIGMYLFCMVFSCLLFLLSRRVVFRKLSQDTKWFLFDLIQDVVHILRTHNSILSDRIQKIQEDSDEWSMKLLLTSSQDRSKEYSPSEKREVVDWDVCEL